MPDSASYRAVGSLTRPLSVKSATLGGELANEIRPIPDMVGGGEIAAELAPREVGNWDKATLSALHPHTDKSFSSPDVGSAAGSDVRKSVTLADARQATLFVSST